MDINTGLFAPEYIKKYEWDMQEVDQFYIDKFPKEYKRVTRFISDMSKHKDRESDKIYEFIFIEDIEYKETHWKDQPEYVQKAYKRWRRLSMREYFLLDMMIRI